MPILTREVGLDGVMSACRGHFNNVNPKINKNIIVKKKMMVQPIAPILIKVPMASYSPQSMNSKIFLVPASCKGIPASAPSPMEP